MRTLCLLLLCSIALFKASGQPGSLDPSFGNNGIQTTGFFNNLNLLDEQGRAVVVSANGDILLVVQAGSSTRIAKYLPDGKPDSSYGNAGYSNTVILNVASAVMQGDKIIVGGFTSNYPNNDFALARFRSDGMLDSSFGVNGKVTTDFNNSDDIVNAIALQGDRIIAAGVSGGDFALARYTADGTLDASFGVNGQVITDFGNPNDNATSIVLQGDKILVGGGSALVRYTADGTLDASFGVNGKVTTALSINAITLQGDTIVLAGSNNGDFALARYTADGTLDTSFGVNGQVITDFGNPNDVVTSITLQGDKILVAGYTGRTGSFQSRDFALARYTARGILDASFGENGKVITDFSDDDVATSIALQGEKIIVGGFIYHYVNDFSPAPLPLPSTYDFALARYTANGALDNSFVEQGLLTGHFPSSQAFFTSTVIQGDKITAAGYALNDNENSDIILVRYTANGTLDASFGVNGKVTTDFQRQDVANAIALQGDKILVAGFANGDCFDFACGGDFALARYTADGTLDASFGVNGLVTTDFEYIDVANAIALQGDKIIVAGFAGNPDIGYYVALARYTADGSLDPSFGVNGKVTTDFFNNSEDFATSVAIQGDEIIVSRGSVLVRYTANGTLDASFGKNGVVTTEFSVNSIALHGDKILAAGGSSGDFALARYTANGVLDASFGVNGLVTTDFNNSGDIVNTITLQEDKIIVGGYAGFIDGNRHYSTGFALARYTADGVLDASFGDNGKVTTHLDGSAFIQDIALHENRLYAVGALALGTYDVYGVVAAYQLEASEPSISISDVTVCESQKQAVVTIRLSAPSSQKVQVNYITRYKTAYPPQDYIGTSGTLQFAAGTPTATIKIAIVDDSVCEHSEQFEVHLRYLCNATIKDSTGVVTITDDDCSLMSAQTSTSSQKQEAQISNSLHIHASPNPSAGAFTIQLHSSDLKQPVSIRVYDIRGRLLEQRAHISIGQSLHLGDQYKPGTYIIEALQGNRSVQAKIIKTGK